MPFATPKVKKIALLLGVMFVSGYAIAQSITQSKAKALDHLVIENAHFAKIHAGFALYDPDEKNWLYTSDADKYYTPASNTKLFTLYAFLKICGQAIPTLRYADVDQGRIIQGTGSPLMLHPTLPQGQQAWNTLRNSSGRLWYSTDNFGDQRLGPGWSWSDYNYSYQAEVSPLPVYGNLIRVVPDSTGEGFFVYPDYFQQSFRYEPDLDLYVGSFFMREEFNNRFFFNQAADTTLYPVRKIPIYNASRQTAVLLSDTLKSPVMVWPASEILPDSFTVVYEDVPDTLLQQFMKDSDNFLAEQLLLCVSHELFDGALDASAAIDSIKRSILSDLPDEARWIDGSGLSRYNLFTPRSIVCLLEKLRNEFGESFLFRVLAAGGKSGTIKDWYGNPDGVPYIFAKTGTLSNKHALSGYLVTKSGRTLIFSFMLNNYLGSSKPLKVEMEKVLKYVRNNF